MGLTLSPAKPKYSIVGIGRRLRDEAIEPKVLDNVENQSFRSVLPAFNSAHADQSVVSYALYSNDRPAPDLPPIR